MKQQKNIIVCLLAATILLLTGCSTPTPEPTPIPTLTPLPTLTEPPKATPTPNIAAVAWQPCQGKGIPSAANYVDDPNAVHKIYVADMHGNTHTWNSFLLKQLQTRDELV